MPRSIRPKPLGPPTKDEPEDSLQHSQTSLASPDNAPPKLKRQQTHIACNACRSARAKCDGKRPCGRCVARALAECYYEVHEGETRMSSLRKKVTALEQEVAFLRELIDTGWDTSQVQLRLRVRQGPSPAIRDDTPRTQSVTTASDVNTPEDGNESSTKGKKRRAESSTSAAQRWAEDVSSITELSAADGRRTSRSQLDIPLPAIPNPRPYETRDWYQVSTHQMPNPYQHSNLYLRVPLPPQAQASTIDILQQPFFEQLCALLDTGQRHPSLASGFAERLDDHIAILAVTRGWAEVVSTIDLDPQWQILRQIDGYLNFMRPIDRLASLRMTRLRMKSLAAVGTAEAEEVQSLLPDWAKPTAIQLTHNHPTIVRYVAWPSIRNYLVTHPSLIGASFFSCMLSCARFLFPVSVQPVVRAPTGMLELVPEFEQSLKDLSCWTLTREFMDRYPVFERQARVFEDHPSRIDSRVDGIGDGVDMVDLDVEEGPG